MSGVEEADVRIGKIAPKCFGARRQKEWIVLAPGRQERRLMFGEIGVKLRVQCHVARVIEKQVELDFVIARPRQKGGIKRIGFRRNQLLVKDALDILPPGGFRREEGAKSCAVRRRRLAPIGLDRIPSLTESNLIGVAVLRDDCCYAIGMLERDPEADRCTICLLYTSPSPRDS